MRTSPWAAWPAGSDPALLSSEVRRAHEAFLCGEQPGPVRRVVLDSWRRSRRCGVDPERPAAPVALTAADLAGHRRDHALAPLLPIARRLILDGSGDGLVVALADDAGRLLWVEGDRTVRRAIERAGFVEGAAWGERDAGTSAPGIALATDHEVQVFGAEHFARAVQPWSCSAAPVHDPSGAVLGVLDVTGGDGVAAPHMLALVRATVAAMEAELAVRRFRDAWQPAPAPRADHARLDVLGRSVATLDGPGGCRTLTLRHSELLLLLAEHPRGLSAEELGFLLHPDGLTDVTVRAEVSRLRRVAGDLLGPSRPYRLAEPVGSDLADVRSLLAAGDVAGAVREHRGPVLPRSDAPGVVRLRAELEADVRAAVAETDDVGAVLAWTLSPAGSQDWEAAHRLTALLPDGSPGAARARARLRLVEEDLGLTSD